MALEVKVNLPKLYDFQKNLCKDTGKHKYYLCSRQVGKTTGACNLAVERLLQGQRIIWLGKTYKQIKDQYRFINRAIPDLLKTENLKFEEMSLITGGNIKFFSSEDPNNIRGDNAQLCIWDEFCYAHPDCWTAVLPLLARWNGKFVLISTPNGLSNHGYDRWIEAEQDPNWETFKADWRVAPHYTEEFINMAKKNMSEMAFAQEFEATFLSVDGSMFPQSYLNTDNIYINDLPKEYNSSSLYVDLASGKSMETDYQAIALCRLDKEGNFNFKMTLCRLPIPDLLNIIKDINEEYNPDYIGFEENCFQYVVANEWFRNFKGAEGKRVSITNKVKKEDRIIKLGTLLKLNKLKIVNDKSGRTTYGQLCDFPKKGQGFFDDGIDAIEGAWRIIYGGNPI